MTTTTINDDGYIALAQRMVVQAFYDLRASVTYKLTQDDKQSAVEFLRSDFAREVVELSFPGVDLDSVLAQCESGIFNWGKRSQW